MIYKAWLRTQRCVFCGAPAPSEQNHVGSHGTAKRNHDEDSCSNCHICHQRWHGITVIINKIKYLPLTEWEKERMRILAKDQHMEWKNGQRRTD